jgi:hypothetical protein
LKFIGHLAFHTSCLILTIYICLVIQLQPKHRTCLLLFLLVLLINLRLFHSTFMWDLNFMELLCFTIVLFSFPHGIKCVALVEEYIWERLCHFRLGHGITRLTPFHLP